MSSTTPAGPAARTMLRRLTALAVVLAALPLAACGSSGASSRDSLTLYNGQHEQTTDGLVTAFKNATGISISVVSNDEDTLANEIAQQGTHSPADVVFTENSPALEFLQGKGMLAKVDASTLAHTPARYNSPDGDWVGVSARVSVLIYNPSLISKGQLPTSVLQLASPKYRGKLAFAPGETDFQPIITSVDRTYGQAKTLSWLAGINANASGHIVADNETVTSDVNSGLVAFGVINQYYWYRLAQEIGKSAIHSQITYFAPHDPGYVIDVSGAAILKSSQHQAAAQKFLAFLVSKQGQSIIGRSGSSEQSFEYPIASGVTTSAPETPFQDLQPCPVTIGELGDGHTALALLQQAGLL